jgi:hypothetical protein
MPTVYLETTIPSYLAARPSRDLIIAAHQQITHEWWRNAGDRFDLYISEAVLAEIRAGDPDAAARRLAIVDGLPLLALNEDVRTLVHAYNQRLRLGVYARADLPHLAFAVAYAMDLSDHLELCSLGQRGGDSSAQGSQCGVATRYPHYCDARRTVGISRRGRGMKDDPIVEEIHQVRQKMLAECNGSLDQLLDRLQTAEAADGDRVVLLEAVRERQQRAQSHHLTTH